jgi:hypothetical protein
MKKIFLLFMSTVLLLTSCGSDKSGGNGNEYKVLSPSELYSRLAEEHLFDTVPAPIMTDISESRYDEFFINPDDAVSIVAKEAAISAFFVQVIIIEAKDGRVGTVLSAMNKHQSNLADETFYPQGVAAAAASVVGSRGNIVYLICDVRGREIESALIKYMESEEV